MILASRTIDGFLREAPDYVELPAWWVSVNDTMGVTTVYADDARSALLAVLECADLSLEIEAYDDWIVAASGAYVMMIGRDGEATLLVSVDEVER